MIRKPVRMIPLCGESPDDWWDNTGSGAVRREADLAAGRDPEFDLDRHFLHDLPDDAKVELLSAEAREPSAAAMAQPCGFTRWPGVPTKVLIARDGSSASSNVASPGRAGTRCRRDRAVTWSLSNPSRLADKLVSTQHNLIRRNLNRAVERLRANPQRVKTSAGAPSLLRNADRRIFGPRAALLIGVVERMIQSSLGRSISAASL
jgi:hypothetical protein